MLSCVQRDGSIGLKQRRRDFSREQVAEYNTRAVWNAVRWVYFGGNEFDFIGPDEQLATGPAEVLRLPQGRGPRCPPARRTCIRLSDQCDAASPRAPHCLLRVGVIRYASGCHFCGFSIEIVPARTRPG